MGRVARSEFRKSLIGKPSVLSERCALCGRPASNLHHVVPKGMGGADDSQIPLIRLCGSGNASGCHGAAHSGHLHFAWDDENGGWVYVITSNAMKDDECWQRYKAMYAPLPGWREIC